MAVKKLDIRIKADSKQAVSGVKATSKALDNMEKEAKETNQASNKLWKEFAKGQFAVDAIKKAFQSLIGIIKGSIDVFSVQEMAEVRLQSAIKLTGQAAKVSFEELDGYARAIQDVTTVGDESSMQIMQLGLTMGIAGDQIHQATQDTLGLSSAYGLDLKTSMKMVALARQGEYTMLQRYIPQLRTTKDLTEKAAIATKVFATGFQMAKDETKTFTGGMKQLKNIWGDVQEELGRGIAQVILPLVKDLANFLKEDGAELVSFFTNIIVRLVDLVKGVFNAVEGILDVAKSVIPGLKTIIYGWEKILTAFRVLFTNVMDEMHKKVQDSTVSLAKTQKTVFDRMLDLKKATGLANEEWVKLMKNYKDIEDPVNRYNQAMIDIKKGKYDKEFKGLSDAVKGQTDAFIKIQKPIKNTADAIKEAVKEVKKIKEMMIDLPEPTKNAATQINLFGENYKDLKTPVFEVVEEMKRQIAESERLEEKMEDLAYAFDFVADVILNLSDILGEDLAYALSNAVSLMASIVTMDIPGIIGGFMSMVSDIAEAIFGASEEEMQRRWADAARQYEEYIEKMEGIAIGGINDFTQFLRGGIDDVESFGAAMNITLRNFAKLAQEGKSFSEIFDIMGEQFDILGAAMIDLKIEGNETFEKLMSWREFTKVNKVLFDSINSLNNALIAMSQTGMVNTQDAFNDFQTLALKNFDKLIAAGADEDQALLAMLPSLRTLNELSKKHGFIIDENLQKKIDIAEEKGLLDEIDPMKEMVRLLGLLVEHFTGLAGSIADAAGEAGNLNREINNMGGGGELGRNNIIPMPVGEKGSSFSQGAENFVIPPGYPNDSFTGKFTSGEILDVRKPGQGSSDRNVNFTIKVIVSGTGKETGVEIGKQVVKGLIEAHKMNRLGLETKFKATG